MILWKGLKKEISVRDFRFKSESADRDKSDLNSKKKRTLRKEQ